MAGHQQRTIDQHHLPATLIAQFADKIQLADRPTQPGRERKVWVRMRNSDKMISSAANKLTIEKRAYDFTEPLLQKIFQTRPGNDWGRLENEWQRYESRLGDVIDKIRSPPDPGLGMTVREILGTLIPHFAGCLVRGHDFARARAPQSPDITRDNVNMYRALEWQRASARLLNWNFCIARPAASSPRFVVNDLGYSLLGLAGPEGGQEPAMAFPLAPDLAMIATHDGGHGSYVAGADGTSSFRAAEMTLVDSDVRSVNRDSCFVAWREIYADTMSVLSELDLEKLRPEPQPSPLGALMLKSLGPRETDFWQNEIIRLELAHLILILEA